MFGSLGLGPATLKVTNLRFFFLGLGLRYSFWCPSDMFCAGHVVESGQLEETVTIQLFFCFLCRCCLGLMEESCNGLYVGF